MKVYTEETSRKHESVIILSKEEGQLLLAMLEAAVDSHKKKLTWKRFLKQLEEKLCCF